MQKGLDPKRLVFIDETWASTNMTPRYGRCERGKRLLAYAPFGHWKTTTFVAALRCDRITAPFVFDGPINGETFLAYVEQGLAPTLSPGDIVIMDNWTCPCLVESHCPLVSFVFEIYWAFVTKSRMPAHGIIEPVDISGDGIFGLKA